MDLGFTFRALEHLHGTLPKGTHPELEDITVSGSSLDKCYVTVRSGGSRWQISLKGIICAAVQMGDLPRALMPLLTTLEERIDVLEDQIGDINSTVSELSEAAETAHERAQGIVNDIEHNHLLDISEAREALDELKARLT